MDLLLQTFLTTFSPKHDYDIYIYQCIYLLKSEFIFNFICIAGMLTICVMQVEIKCRCKRINEFTCRLLTVNLRHIAIIKICRRKHITCRLLTVKLRHIACLNVSTKTYSNSLTQKRILYRYDSANVSFTSCYKCVAKNRFERSNAKENLMSQAFQQYI